MCRTNVIIAFALGLAVAWVGPVFAADAPSGAPRMGTRIGQMYPDFVLSKLDGGFGRLSDYRGRKVLLVNFASW